MATIETVIAAALGIDPGKVVDDLGYDDIPEWDSVAHFNLMMSLEEAYGLRIDEDLMVELTSVRAIRSVVAPGPSR